MAHRLRSRKRTRQEREEYLKGKEEATDEDEEKVTQPPVKRCRNDKTNSEEDEASQPAIKTSQYDETDSDKDSEIKIAMKDFFNGYQEILNIKKEVETDSLYLAVIGNKRQKKRRRKRHKRRIYTNFIDFDYIYRHFPFFEKMQ